MPQRVVRRLLDLDDRQGFPHDCSFEYQADPHVQATPLGTRIARVHQYYRGIPVFDSLRTIFLGDDDEIDSVEGARIQIRHTQLIEPLRSAAQSVADSADFLRSGGVIRKHRLAPARVVYEFPLPSQPTVLSKRGYSNPISASLSLFPCGEGCILGWRVQIGLADAPAYDMLVRADGGFEVLYCKQTASFVEGKAFVLSTGFGRESTKTEEDLPSPITTYPTVPWATLPTGFPRDWVDGKQTIGNNAKVCTAKPKEAFTGSKDNDRVVFKSANPTGNDQERINAFYWVSFLHDFFYLFGFREAEGNMQRKNYGGGRDGDAVEVWIKDVLRRPLPGNIVKEVPAYAKVRPDGRKVKIFLGKHPVSGNRAALDPDTIIHEYVHAVVERLVGGPNTHHIGMSKPQGKALAEGYCDYFAVTIRQHFFPEDSGKKYIGDWLTGTEQGIRDLPYDDTFPGHFGLLGQADWDEAHDAGRIWAATLISLNRSLGEALGSTELGHVTGWQLVVESLSCIAPHENAPTFLDARDSIDTAYTRQSPLRASLTEAQCQAMDTAIPAIFARYGMGSAAHSSSPSYDGIVADPSM
ncbi:MAG: hypothetical protein GY906_05220 [bacterium]|nr:hypothetical protein [bacterium]